MIPFLCVATKVFAHAKEERTVNHREHGDTERKGRWAVASSAAPCKKLPSLRLRVSVVNGTSITPFSIH